MNDFRGKTVLVTGATKGAGRAVAERFARQGAHVILNYFHSREDGESALASLVEAGLSAELVRASVAKRESVEQMFADIGERHGGLDILVNNAAYGAFRPFFELAEKDWARVMNTNFNGIRWSCRAAVPLMITRGGGAIVNVSSIGANVVVDNYVAVACSKGALEALSRYLAVELAPMGIRVNCASTGLITGRVAELFPRAAEMRAVNAAATPLGRLGTGEDLADVVTYLASTQSGWVTGQTIVSDGGLTLGNALVSPPRPAREQVRFADPPPRAPANRLVAVVGMGLVVPGASSPEDMWTLLNSDQPVFSEPRERYRLDDFWSADMSAEDRTYARVSGYIHDYTPHPTLRRELDEGVVGSSHGGPAWLRHSLLQAMDGVRRSESDRSGFYVGHWVDGSQHLEESVVMESVLAAVRTATGTRAADGDLRAVAERHLPYASPEPWRLLPDEVVRGAMRGVLSDDSEVIVVDTACSSSLYAMDIGVKKLLGGECDVAFCGGVQELGPLYSVLFSKLKGLSFSSDVRGFDADADGTLFTDAACVITLKTLDRALADGDEVLGVLTGFGASSDGRGKAIYAPNQAGQRLSIERARKVCALEPREVDWVIAHATGTVAGDSVELRTIVDSAASAPLTVTSNKSLLGHTGWAAGAVSVAHAVLALRYDAIPGQRRYTGAPGTVSLESVRVPTEDVPWPSVPGRPRTVGVSGFGFGGTNGHLILQEHHREMRLSSSPPSSDGPAVLVGWSALLPGKPGRQQIRRWLSDGFPEELTFGQDYPAPTFHDVRLPPATVRAVDRTQLMALQVMRLLAAEHGELWAGLTRSTGVFAGSMEPLRVSGDYSIRAYAAILHRIAEDLAAEFGDAAGYAVLRLLDEVRERSAPSGENTLPGLMPNVVPARVCNQLNLQGLNMAVGAGHDSVLAALHLAELYLRSGELDLAVVLGVSGNSTPWASALVDAGETRIAEGAFAFAVTRAEVAAERGWPVLAQIGTHAGPPRVADKDRSSPTFLGADGAVRILRALHGSGAATLRGMDQARGLTVQITPPGTAQITPGGGEQTLTERHVLVERADPGRAVCEPLPAVPRGALVLTDSAAVAERMAAQVERAQGTLICSDDTCRTPRARVIDELGSPEPEISPTPVRDIRVISCPPTRWPVLPEPRTRRLHELLFLAAKQHQATLEPGGSILALALGASAAGPVHPHAALLAGTVKSLFWELPECQVFTLATDESDLSSGLAQLEAESTRSRTLPLVRRHRGARYLQHLRAAPLPDPSDLSIGADSVVVVAGGTRGITAECVVALARRTRAKLWILGTISPDELTPGSDEDLDAGRPAYLRTALREEPRLTVAEHNARFDRLVRARDAGRTLSRLRSLVGEDRVVYVACDVLDGPGLREVAERVRAEDGKVDLLVFGAGINRAASLATKSLSDFRSVLDVKILGYHHLKEAFGEVAAWCNFGSLAGVLGQPGEADYGAANDYLGFAAEYERTVLGHAEHTMAWTLWVETGMGSSPVVRAQTARRGALTGISSAEGSAHFLNDLALPRPADAVVIQLGDREKRTVRGRMPGLLLDDAAGAGRSFVFLDEEVERGERHGVWQRVLDLERDAYLREHPVDGKPTVPATLQLEMAAEAATSLVPGTRVRAYDSAEFMSFLRVHPGRPGPLCRISADIVDVSGPETTVRVTVASDLVHTSGRVLARDRIHGRMDVVLIPEDLTVPAPHQPPGPDHGGREVPDPYYLPGSPVALSGRFAASRDCRLLSHSSRSTLDLPLDPQDPIFLRMVVPFITLDSLARVAVLDPASPGRLAVAAPAGFGRIELFTSLNDCQIAKAHGASVQLHWERSEQGVSRCSAVSADGQVLARIHDLRLLVLGWGMAGENGWECVEVPAGAPERTVARS